MTKGGPSAQRRGVVRAAAWCAGLVGVWLLTLSSVSTPELVAAVVCAVVAAAGMAAGRRAARLEFAGTMMWLKWAGPLVVGIPTDTARLLWLAARRAGGATVPGSTVRTHPVTVRRPSARDRAGRAVASLVISATPGTIVLDWPPEGELRVHALGGGPPIDEVVVP